MVGYYWMVGYLMIERLAITGWLDSLMIEWLAITDWLDGWIIDD